MSPALYQLSYLAFELCKISNPAPKVNRGRKKRTASQNGAGRCAVTCFGVPPCTRHALVSAPFSVAHSGRPSKQASRLRSRLCIPCRRRIESADGGRDALSRDARKGGMAFGAHEPPRTRRRPRPCRANPHCGGAPTNAALKGGFPESVSSRSTAENRILRGIEERGSVTQYSCRPGGLDFRGRKCIIFANFLTPDCSSVGRARHF